MVNIKKVEYYLNDKKHVGPIDLDEVSNFSVKRLDVHLGIVLKINGIDGDVIVRNDTTHFMELLNHFGMSQEDLQKL